MLFIVIDEPGYEATLFQALLRLGTPSLGPEVHRGCVPWKIRVCLVAEWIGQERLLPNSPLRDGTQDWAQLVGCAVLVL